METFINDLKIFSFMDSVILDSIDFRIHIQKEGMLRRTIAVPEREVHIVYDHRELEKPGAYLDSQVDSHKAFLDVIMESADTIHASAGELSLDDEVVRAPIRPSRKIPWFFVNNVYKAIAAYQCWKKGTTLQKEMDTEIEACVACKDTYAYLARQVQFGGLLFSSFGDIIERNLGERDVENFGRCVRYNELVQNQLRSIVRSCERMVGYYQNFMAEVFK